jgi:hypothetical protein
LDQQDQDQEAEEQFLDKNNVQFNKHSLLSAQLPHQPTLPLVAVDTAQMITKTLVVPSYPVTEASSFQVAAVSEESATEHQFISINSNCYIIY